MYEIERDEFREVFDPKFVEFFIDKLFDEHFFINTENFICFYDDYFDEVYIIHKDSLYSDKLIAINWYKPWHVGRALQLAGIGNKEELKVYRDLLANELNYIEEENTNNE